MPSLKAKRVANMSTQQLLARAAAYRAARPQYSAPRSFHSPGGLKGTDILLTQAAPIVTTTGTNANIMLLNGIAPGNGSYNRIGRKVSLKSLRLKGAVEFSSIPSATGVEVGNFVRMVVVWDRQPGGVIPTWDTVFGYTLQDATEASTIMAPLRYDNMSRFTVIKDKIIDYSVQPSSPVSTAAITEQVDFDEYINLGGKVTTYSGQSAPTTIADIATGALYVMWRAYSNNVGQASAAVSAISVARLRYLD